MNYIGSSNYNALMTEGRDLVWMQDDTEQNVWGRWAVTYRDVQILDPQNRVFAIYNLTEHDLAQPENQAELKQLFLQAARITDTDLDGLPDSWEEQNFGSLAADPDGDPDQDRRDNKMEFAFGTDPNLPDPPMVFRPTMQPGGSLSVQFRRRAGSVLDYVVEASPDLEHWTADSSVLQLMEGPRNLYDGTGTAEERYLFIPPAGEKNGFLRVEAIPH